MEEIALRRPELMAPAGDMISLRAALDSGADAVYFGIVSMNMRANAKNFAVEDLPEVARQCHEAKAKAYLALNTIIFDHETELAEKLINAAAEAGIDAIICWDFSVVELALKHKMKVILSTQMSVANAHSMAFLYKSFGICRFVLARECTLEEITSIRRNLKLLLGADAEKIEIEVFAHGAMCVSVSGRCFMSQFAFGESANRGECRQPCRREYLIKDIREGKEFLLGQNYVMSPKDLCSLPFLEKFRKATLEELLLIDGIGEIMARNILEADLSDYSCLGGEYGFQQEYQQAEKLGNALEGITVIFTGTSYRFKRDEIKTFFTGHGAKYVGSVSGKVDYVVIGDAPGQNKLDKARQLGVEVIAERDFYAKFNL